MKSSSCSDAVSGAPRTRTAARAAGSPNAKRTAVTCSKGSSSARKRPRTVPSAQSAAAPSAKKTGARPCSETSNGLGNAISQAPARPPARKTPKRPRGRSPSSAAASDTAISGCTFCRTTGVTGSPSTNAWVKRIVASAEDPAPITIPAATKRGPARQRAGSAAMTTGSRTATRTTCSPKTIVAGSVERASGRRMSASMPQRPAATATAATPMLALLGMSPFCKPEATPRV